MNKELEANTTISHYRIVEKIGAGGMGEVFLAEDTRLDRRVALKILPAELAENSDRMRRFVLEAKATSALNHPNIITIYEIGAEGEMRFIAAEYIEGETLRERLKASSFSADDCLEVAVQITSALQAAHAVNIVHRDIKPENIMIRPDGLVKILDFGIAKLTEKRAEITDAEAATKQQAQTALGMIIGTAAYMSPEQAQGKAVDARSDIFSFGVVLYEMLAGRQPFEGENAIDVIGRILHKEPIPVKELATEVPAELERIINKTLCKDCRERYQSAKDLLIDLKALQKRLDFEAEVQRSSQANKQAESPAQIIKAATVENNGATNETSFTNSIAVLPFSNMSADEDNEYFCDGLAEELLNALAKIDDLKVAARTSAFSFKNKNIEVSEIGNALNVKTVLEGSVRKSGSKLRITVQLINASDGYHLWSERYDREMRDIFDVQDEITLSVVDALKVRLLGDEKEAMLKRYTSNAEAYQLYLRGRFFFFKRTPEGFRKAIEYFERAIEIDAGYAVAYSGLADCYIFLGFYEEMPPAEAKKNLQPFAEKASELDDTLAETCVSLALCKTLYEWDFIAGSEEFKKAIALNPKYAFAHHLDSATLITLGLYDEAVAAEKRAIELEPFTAVFNASLGWWYHISRRADEAILQSLKTIEIAPNHFFAYWVLGLAYGQTGRFPEAVSSLEKAISLTGGSQHIKGDLGRICAMSGRRAEALKVLSEFAEEAKEKYVSAVNLAKIYVGLGEREQMYQQLEKAVEKRSVRLPYFVIDPALDDYRLEPRFQNITRRIGLPIEQIPPTAEILEAQTVMLNQATGDGEKKVTSPADSHPTQMPSEDGTQNFAGKSPGKQKWLLIALLSLIVFGGGFFGYRYFTAHKQIESIAVMPFTNESGSADNEYLSDGMTETLINSLSQIPNLSVKARSSVFRYKGKDTNPQTIGKELNVQAILNGRVVQRGEQLTLSLELIDAQTENVIWSESYNRKQTDLVSLQSEIARDVSGKLKTKLSGAEQAKVAKTYTTDSEAYRLYLQGRFYWNKRAGREFEKAESYFRQAVEKDPNFALGYVGLADTNEDEDRPRKKEYILRALALDDSLAEAHASLGYQYMLDYDWAASERELKRAMELNPNYPQAYGWNGARLMMLGRYDESMASIKRALEIDPTAAGINFYYGVLLFVSGNADESIRQFKKLAVMEPTLPWAHTWLSHIYRQQGNYAAAVEERAESLEINDKPDDARLVRESFRKDGWNGFLHEMIRQNEISPNTSRALPASFFALLGEKEKAIAELIEAAKEGDFWLFRIKFDPAFDSLRGDARFQELLKIFEPPR